MRLTNLLLGIKFDDLHTDLIYLQLQFHFFYNEKNFILQIILIILIKISSVPISNSFQMIQK